MRETDLAYMAGIFDGEGCIIIAKALRKARPSYYLVCQIHITDEYIVNLFHSCFGGIVLKQKKKEPHHKTMWAWRCVSRIAQAFLETILPHLRLKGSEAEEGIKLQKLVSSHRRGTKMTNEQATAREAQKILLSSMKRE